MSAGDRSALIVADESQRVERFLAPLRRANLSLVRAQHAWDAEREFRHTPFDLIVAALPLLGAERVLGNLRAPQCAARHAGLIVIGEDEELGPHDLVVGRLANRLLPGSCSLVEFQQQVNELLDVAPRVAVPDGVRLQLMLPAGDQVELWLENLSTSGMLMRALETLPVGSDFGFALEFENQPMPIRGRARVVRHASPNRLGHWGVAARFLALGGEAPQRIHTLVERARFGEAGSGEPPLRTPSRETVAARSGTARAKREAASGDEMASCRAELDALTPVLDETLERGLLRRLNVADWYVTGAELGLESLRAFSSILSSIYENRAVGLVAQRRLADLIEVRDQLLEFGRPQQEVATRVRILLALRPALHRLLQELDEGAAGESRSPGIVAQTAVEIRRLVGARRSLATLVELLAELRRPRLLPLTGGARRSPEQIRADYGPLALAFGIPLSAATLRSRRGVRELSLVVQHEEHALARRLQTIHRKAFSLELRRLATDDAEADLEGQKLHRALSETLEAGAEYLARSYAAYRHALEAVEADPAWIDRAERLANILLAAERSREAAVPAPGAESISPLN